MPVFTISLILPLKRRIALSSCCMDRDERKTTSFLLAAPSFPRVRYMRRGARFPGRMVSHFRRKPDRELDIDDLKHQATRLCGFVAFVCQQTAQEPLLVGYSNGAIVAAETMCQAHHLSKGAILLRPLSPRKDQPLPNLAGYPVLLLAGVNDDRRHPSDAPHLAEQLVSAGADAVLETINTGHGWAEDAADERLSRRWLARGLIA